MRKKKQLCSVISNLVVHSGFFKRVAYLDPKIQFIRINDLALNIQFFFR